MVMRQFQQVTTRKERAMSQSPTRDITIDTAPPVEFTTALTKNGVKLITPKTSVAEAN